MQNKFLILYMAIGLTISTNAEVKVSVSGYGDDIQGASISTDDNGNTNYIYVDKGSHIVNSTIGSTVIVNRKFTKEEGLSHYKKKIDRYEDKIDKYHGKINTYHDKIAEKPKYRERYQDKIDNYHDKINEYKRKITEAEIKLKEYQKMK